jgi:hypothetical protein
MLTASTMLYNMQNLSFCDCLTSPGIMPSRLIHIYHIWRASFFLRLNNIPICVSTIVSLSIHQLMDIQIVSTWIMLQQTWEYKYFFGILVLFLLYKYPERRWNGSTMLSFWGTSILISIAAALFLHSYQHTHTEDTVVHTGLTSEAIFLPESGNLEDWQILVRLKDMGNKMEEYSSGSHHQKAKIFACRTHQSFMVFHYFVTGTLRLFPCAFPPRFYHCSCCNSQKLHYKRETQGYCRFPPRTIWCELDPQDLLNPRTVVP